MMTNKQQSAKVSGRGWLVRMTAAVLLAGVVWRLVRFALAQPLWGDEAMLAVNLWQRPLSDIFQPLDYCQVAPGLFLVLQKLAMLLGGTSEWAMRLVPTLAGLAGLGLFVVLAKENLRPFAAAAAIGMVSAGTYMTRHAVELKPYSFDFLVATALLLLASRAWRRPDAGGPWWGLVGLVVPAIGCSFPAVFVAGGVSVALLPVVWTQQNRRWAYFAYNILLVGAFGGSLWLYGQSQMSVTQSGMTAYWRESFPPVELWRWPVWLLQTHSGNMFAHPAGGKNGASVVTLLLVLAGIAVWMRSQRRGLLWLWLTPFALTLVAATLQKYPYGGSARVAMHLAPIIILLAASGAEWAGRWLRSQFAIPRMQSFAVTMGAMVLLAVAGTAVECVRPYKSVSDLQVREFFEEADESQPGVEQVVIPQPRLSVPGSVVWYAEQMFDEVCWETDLATVQGMSGAVWVANFHHTGLAADLTQVDGKRLSRSEMRLRLCPEPEPVTHCELECLIPTAGHSAE